MTKIELYSNNSCPFAQRTRMVLIEKGLEFTLNEIDLGNRPDWFLEVSPYGKVPCLRHGGQVIYESTIINEYLEEVFPQRLLMPSDPMERAQARVWLHYCDNYYLTKTANVAQFHSDPEKQQEAIAQLVDTFHYIEHEGLTKLSDGPFWLGSKVSLVDIQYAPFFERLFAYEALWDVRVPDTCPRLQRWRDVVQDCESYQKTASSTTMHIEVIKRFFGIAA